MALNYAKLQDVAQLAGAAAAIITNAAGEKIHIKGITLHNTNTTTELVKLYLPPDAAGAAGAAADSNKVFEYGMEAKETFDWVPPFPITLSDGGDSLNGFSTTANKVNIVLLGLKDA
jgi:hypothetical protein